MNFVMPMKLTLRSGTSTKHVTILRLVTKAKTWKGVGQEYNPGVTYTFSKVWESVKE
jgi:hypothetical protein